MQVKISKTLEGIIARAAFNTTKAGIDHSLKDFLMLEMLREEGSLAYQLWKDHINLIAELNNGKYFSGGIYFKIHLK